MYSLRPILCIASLDVSRIKICLDTYIIATSNMDHKEYISLSKFSLTLGKMLLCWCLLFPIWLPTLVWSFYWSVSWPHTNTWLLFVVFSIDEWMCRQNRKHAYLQDEIILCTQSETCRYMCRMHIFFFYCFLYAKVVMKLLSCLKLLLLTSHSCFQFSQRFDY
jgi:hypothetical protein